MPEANQAAAEGSSIVPLENSTETDDGVVFTFGKEKILVPPLSFYTIKKCWEFLGRVSAATDLIGRIDSVLEVVSVALSGTDKPESVDDLAKKLVGVKWQQEISDSFRRLLIVSGLITQEQLDLNDSGVQQPPNPQSGGEVASSTPSSAESLNGAQAATTAASETLNDPTLTRSLPN